MKILLALLTLTTMGCAKALPADFIVNPALVATWNLRQTTCQQTPTYNYQQLTINDDGSSTYITEDAQNCVETHFENASSLGTNLFLDLYSSSGVNCPNFIAPNLGKATLTYTVTPLELTTTFESGCSTTYTKKQ